MINKLFLIFRFCLYKGNDTDINANNTSEDKRPNYFQDSSHHISMHESTTTELVPLSIYPTDTDLQYDRIIIILTIC